MGWVEVLITYDTLRCAGFLTFLLGHGPAIFQNVGLTQRRKDVDDAADMPRQDYAFER